MSATLTRDGVRRYMRGATLFEFFSHAINGESGTTLGLIPQYLRAFAACLIPWTIYGVFGLVQELSRRLYWEDPAPLRGTWFWSVHVLQYALMSPFVLWLGARWPFERRRLSPRLALHFVFALCFALVRVAVACGIQYPLNRLGVIGPWPWLEEPGAAIVNALVYGLYGGFISYWVVLSVQGAFRLYEKFRERERETVRLELHASELRAQASQARLDALKVQLQPHFLFNTLNAIVVLVRQQKQQQAEEVLTRFSDLLRAILDDMEAQEVPLHRELTYLKLYLSIEQLRFPDRLQISIEPDQDVLDAAIPHMGLQPVIENSLRHGIGRRAAGGSIEIRACRVGTSLQISVRDDGPGPLQYSAEGGYGMGLANLRARLQQLYGEQGSLQLEQVGAGGTMVRIALPLRRHPDAHTED